MGAETANLYGLVLSGAFVLAFVNIVKKKLLTEGIHEDSITAISMFGAGLSALAAELLINGTGVFAGNMLTRAFLAPLAVSAVLNIFIQYGNVLAMKHEDASIVIPLSATMPMFVIVMSWVLLKEWPTFNGRIGISAIAFGSYILALKGVKYPLPSWAGRLMPKSQHERAAFWLTPWLRLGSSKGARIALGIAYLGAVSVNFDKIATLASSPMIFSGLVFSFVAAVVWSVSKYRGRWEKVEPKVFWKILGIGAAIGIGASLMNAGYIYGIVPYVGALKRTQILLGVLLAWAILKEEHAAWRLVGAFFIFIGATMILF